jgi:CMP-2-keto-3-deoxyoctulosonic acid synthetase
VRPLARVVALGEQAAELVERARRRAQDAVRVVVDERDRAQYFSK